MIGSKLAHYEVTGHLGSGAWTSEMVWISQKPKWQVFSGGGIQPRWRPDGRELYFISPDGKLMATSITAGVTFAAGTPVALFPVAHAQGAGSNKQEYIVSRDGRFLINQPAETSTTKPITLILNWKPR